MKILKVREVGEIQKDVNGFPYKVVTFETPGEIITAGKRIKVPAKRSGRSFQGMSYLSLFIAARDADMLNEAGQVEDWKKLPKEVKEKGEPEFGFDLKSGDYVAGDIVTKEVEPYEITDTSTGEVREVNQYTRVILGNSDDPNWQTQVFREFLRAGHTPIEYTTASHELVVQEEIA